MAMVVRPAQQHVLQRSVYPPGTHTHTHTHSHTHTNLPSPFKHAHTDGVTIVDKGVGEFYPIVSITQKTRFWPADTDQTVSELKLPILNQSTSLPLHIPLQCI